MSVILSVSKIPILSRIVYSNPSNEGNERFSPRFNQQMVLVSFDIWIIDLVLFDQKLIDRKDKH